MNKQELVEKMAGQANLTTTDAEAALNAFIGAVETTLQHGDKIQITGFGSFETSQRAARTGRNPQTGQPIQIAAAVVPKFKAGKKLKDVVNDQA